MNRTTKPAFNDYDGLYMSRANVSGPPWEIGEPQPAMAAVIEQDAVGERVLDVGCGTGDLAIHLATRGHRVTGVDISSVAIEKAKQKAEGHGLNISFRVADAAHLETIGETFDAVFDSGLLHSLDGEDQARYISGLLRICAKGAAVYVLAVSLEAGLGWGVTEAALREAFGHPSWSSTTIVPVDVAARMEGTSLQLPAFLLATRWMPS